MKMKYVILVVAIIIACVAIVAYIWSNTSVNAEVNESGTHIVHNFPLLDAVSYVNGTEIDTYIVHVDPNHPTPVP